MTIFANHPFARRMLNVLDENGNEGCAHCGRQRAVHPVATDRQSPEKPSQPITPAIVTTDVTFDAPGGWPVVDFVEGGGDMSKQQELALKAESALAELLALKPGFWDDDDKVLRAALAVVRKLAA